MKEFTSISQFRDVVTRVRRFSDANRIPLPKWTFVGRPKLHGTNGGLHLTAKGELRAQSRNRIIDPSCDNAGFAAWMETNREALTTLVSEFNPRPGTPITVYGEWCGGSIQPTVALSQCPKHFVVFSAWLHYGAEDGEYVDFGSVMRPDGQGLPLTDHSIGLYHICEAPSVGVEIDFNNPHFVQDRLSEVTMRWEECCPWAREQFDVEGIGEGLVWTCQDRPFDSDLWFKTKGDKHAKGAKASKVRIVADPEKLASVKELVERIVPQWRLEQGVTALKEQGVALDTSAVGAYLQWVCRDTLKEETDTIVASGFDWKKDVNSHVIQKARQFFLQHLNELAGV